jgi:hypothetical protein
VRPLARAADGIAHNRERRRTIHRYRHVQCVVLVPDRSADSVRDA